MIAVLRMPEATYLMQIFASAFLAILFLQSGIDKVVDRRGNFEWLKGHFAKSPLAGIVPALLICITILEVAAGVLSGVGCVLIILLQDSTDRVLRGDSFRRCHDWRSFLGNESLKIMLERRCLFPYFCLRWSQDFICSRSRSKSVATCECGRSICRVLGAQQLPHMPSNELSSASF